MIVRGEDPSDSTVQVQFFRRRQSWRQVAVWPGHIGLKGWAERHREGDLRTPIGTFTLSDAGGRKPDPGTGLPYHHSSRFVVPDSDPAFGDDTSSAFDYVVAIDFNRVPGRSPLDPERPDGVAQGGGIWIHVDHDGPTHGCVSIPEQGMRFLLRHLAPTDHPVVVMGDDDHLLD